MEANRADRGGADGVDGKAVYHAVSPKRRRHEGANTRPTIGYRAAKVMEFGQVQSLFQLPKSLPNETKHSRLSFVLPFGHPDQHRQTMTKGGAGYKIPSRKGDASFPVRPCSCSSVADGLGQNLHGRFLKMR